MDTIVRLTGAERGFLMLRDEQGALSIRIARNLEQDTLEDGDVAAGDVRVAEGVAGHVQVEGAAAHEKL